MAEFLFPLQFRRQYDAPLDIDIVFTTTADRTAYLSNARRYAGQIVFDVQDGKVYALNSAKDTWLDIGRQGSSYFLPLTGGSIVGDLTIHGSLTSTGTQTFANTLFQTTSAIRIENVGSGAALYVEQDGQGDIASFYDKNTSVEVLHVAGSDGSNPGVGVRTSTPNKEFTVSGEISASSDIWSSGVIRTSLYNSNDWNSNYSSVSRVSANWDAAYSATADAQSVYSSVNRVSANWDSVYSSVSQTSANWDSVYSSVSQTSANWDSVYSSVSPASANWDSVYSSVNPVSANWNSVYSSVNPVSANWDSVYSSVKTTSANWDSAYNSVSQTSANWDSVYSSVNPVSANWNSVYSSVNPVSANWNNSYTLLQLISGEALTVKKFDIQNGGLTSYSGVALYGDNPTGDPTVAKWKVNRLGYTFIGTVTSNLNAYNITWNERLTATYS